MAPAKPATARAGAPPAVEDGDAKARQRAMWALGAQLPPGDLADPHARVAALDRDLLDLATRWMRGARRPAPDAEYPLIVARKRTQDKELTA